MSDGTFSQEEIDQLLAALKDNPDPRPYPEEDPEFWRKISEQNMAELEAALEAALSQEKIDEMLANAADIPEVHPGARPYFEEGPKYFRSKEFEQNRIMPDGALTREEIDGILAGIGRDGDYMPKYGPFRRSQDFILFNKEPVIYSEPRKQKQNLINRRLLDVKQNNL
ncbi:MAG: hypothetical protein LBL21_04070 [Rickettsiales bacterium]|jgi:hypothetical protein|nr:hypothetical protein [Rickettsiales bacterium]